MGKRQSRARQLRHGLAVVLTFGVVALGALPAVANEDEGGGLLSSVLSGTPTNGDANRPASAPEPRGAVDRTTPPAALVTPSFTSATAGADRVPLIVPDAALPLRFAVDRRLADRHGERAVYDAMRQWDTIPGSRWATAYGGLVDGVGAAPDGRSVIFAKDDCPPGTGGFAHWQSATAASDSRYGAEALYVTEVDIAICDSVTTPEALRQVLAHEVGHALGLGHLCDPGESCWQPGMGNRSHACRLMYAGKSTCQARMDGGDADGAVHLYPKLERLSGPSRVETAARASYASFPQGSASAVVIADAGGPAHGPLAGAALSGLLDAAFLLATPDPATCLTGAAAEELSRVADQLARVILIGSWPSSCTGELRGWGLRPELVNASSAVGLGVAVADLVAGSGQLQDTAVLVSSAADEHGHVPDGVAGGAAAAVAGGPILYTGREGLDPAVRAWMDEHRGALRQVYLLGGGAALADAVAADVRLLGLSVVRIAGPSRVDTALALASRAELFGSSRSVVIAAAGSWPDAVTGAAVGARTGAPVLLTPPRGHAGVQSWLAARSPDEGWFVGGSAALPYELQWRYSRLTR